MPLHSTVLAPVSELLTEGQDSIQTFIPADANGQVGTKSLSYRRSTCVRKPTHLCTSPCSSAGVLPAESCWGTCQRSTSKTCPLSSMPASAARLQDPMGIFTPVLKPYLSLLEHPSSSLLDGSLPCDVRGWACMALPCWGRGRVVSL